MTGQEIWSKIKDELANEKNVTYDTYNNYINKTKFITIEDNKLYLSINSKIGFKVINKLKDIMKELSYKLLNESYEFVFLNSSNVRNDIPNEGTLIKKPIKKDFTFNNYIKGSTNQNAVEAAKDVVENINKWNPLFIYGETGVGKTHLLKAMKYEILKKYDNDIKIHFVNSQDFGNEIATLLSSKNNYDIQKFKNGYFEWDVLIFDDIQVLSNRTKTNEILFNVFNYFIENEKQIIFSSDRIPEKLAYGFEKRLVSRFSSGLTIKIDSPDYDTAYKIMINLLNENDMTNAISDELINYIVKKFGKYPRKITGIIKQIKFHLKIFKKENEILELDEFKKYIINSEEIKDDISLKMIVEIVGKEFNISKKDILSSKRQRDISKARKLSMYLVKKNLGKTFSEIGNEFNGRNHSTVLGSCKEMEELIANDKQWKKICAKIETKLNNS